MVAIRHELPAIGETAHLAFATLSGDFNPQHVDQTVARRLMFGERVVHGIHSVLSVLDFLVKHIDGFKALSSLRISFDEPVGVNDALSIEFEHSSDDIRFTLYSQTRRAVHGRIKVGAAFETSSSVPQLGKERHCKELRQEELLGKSGAIPLALDPHLLSVLFPHLSRSFSARQIAILLATTRLVGMECPGLHSIFGGMKIAFDRKDESDAELKYKVSSWHPNYRMLQIQVENGGNAGIIDCFFRPEPLDQASSNSLKTNVIPKEFATQRVLIIGGTRGLGEVVAKIIALGGGNVVLTFHHGFDDANRVVEDIQSVGGTASCVQFDVLNPNAASFTDRGTFTHLYYFATPRIRPGTASSFDAGLFQHYVAYYVTGFIRTIEVIRNNLAHNATIIYPSTYFLDSPDTKFREYSAAKEVGEVSAKHIVQAHAGFRLLCPRLPRLRTDQTQALVDLDAEDPAPCMLRVARGDPGPAAFKAATSA